MITPNSFGKQKQALGIIRDRGIAIPDERGRPQFRQYAEAIAPLIVPGTRERRVFRSAG